MNSLIRLYLPNYTLSAPVYSVTTRNEDTHLHIGLTKEAMGCVSLSDEPNSLEVLAAEHFQESFDGSNFVVDVNLWIRDINRAVVYFFLENFKQFSGHKKFKQSGVYRWLRGMPFLSSDTKDVIAQNQLAMLFRYVRETRGDHQATTLKLLELVKDQYEQR